MELRKARRYRVIALASFQWWRPEGGVESGDGITRDVSSGGVFIETAVLPPAGAYLELSVRLPPMTRMQRQLLQLTGEGTVVRADGCGRSESGFAAEVIFNTESSRHSRHFP